MLQECRGTEFSNTVGKDERARIDTAYRIIADHVRMMTVAITDGLVPSRRESGYVFNTSSLMVSIIFMSPSPLKNSAGGIL